MPRGEARVPRRPMRRDEPATQALIDEYLRQRDAATLALSATLAHTKAIVADPRRSGRVRGAALGQRLQAVAALAHLWDLYAPDCTPWAARPEDG